MPDRGWWTMSCCRESSRCCRRRLRGTGAPDASGYWRTARCCRHPVRPLHRHPVAVAAPGARGQPVGRGRTDAKHHVICDATGIPLVVTLTGGIRNDVTATPAAACGGTAHPRQALSAPPAAEGGLCRPRLRSRLLSPPDPGQGHQAGDRPPGHRPWLRAGNQTVGHREGHRTAALVRPPAHPPGGRRNSEALILTALALDEGRGGQGQRGEDGEEQAETWYNLNATEIP